MATADYASVVRFAGVSADGPQFDILVNIPEGNGRDVGSTERQRQAVADFYGKGIEQGLTFSQAHGLLSYREYARSCASAICVDSDSKTKLMFSRLIAAFISSSMEISAYAAARSNRRFRAGTEAERIMQTRFFGEISDFCAYVLNVLREQGFAI